MTEKWDRHFLSLALTHARMSKDPSTKVGAIIVGPDKDIMGSGYNGLPRGIADTDERLSDRDAKLRLTVHAEINACIDASHHRIGIRRFCGTMYITATDKDGAVWGGPPCVRCLVEMLQFRLVSEIVSFPFKTVPSRWQADLAWSRDLLAEAGINYREVPL